MAEKAFNYMHILTLHFIFWSKTFALNWKNRLLFASALSICPSTAFSGDVSFDYFNFVPAQERFRQLIFQMPDVIHAANLMIESSKILGIPLVVTEQYPKALGHTVQELDITEAWKEEKLHFSMFTPKLQDFMKTIKRNQVCLFGIETHVCIQQTALDLLENNFDVHLLVDGTSSQSIFEFLLALTLLCRPLDRSVAIRRLESSGALLTTSETVLFELLGHSKHTHFKEISKLLRIPRENPTLSSL
ncbi:putative Isochorismatase domain-containing protein 1 [Cardiosporidium cionae]|uniref:Isochorismatase domain-containing protein 1 n=1 Tax=Cardiosporidium cionae TaxID=476202 RepID=A0ABQ7JD64_9APIC|nr:putative Isochorismatase domain-containing protein 1 [Cardiosporidium cionae]|eukprot:KAF8821938.1 putative Isochorismatase domain-containing protein 1 [Cardiosporidium cionae]